eukprot:m51a1_g8055 hypothetical protein (352) ;mRNA; f:120993-122530
MESESDMVAALVRRIDALERQVSGGPAPASPSGGSGGATLYEQAGQCQREQEALLRGRDALLRFLALSPDCRPGLDALERCGPAWLPLRVRALAAALADSPLVAAASAPPPPALEALWRAGPDALAGLAVDARRADVAARGAAEARRSAAALLARAQRDAFEYARACERVSAALGACEADAQRLGGATLYEQAGQCQREQEALLRGRDALLRFLALSPDCRPGLDALERCGPAWLPLRVRALAAALADSPLVAAASAPPPPALEALWRAGPDALAGLAVDARRADVAARGAAEARRSAAALLARAQRDAFEYARACERVSAALGACEADAQRLCAQQQQQQRGQREQRGCS